MDSSTFVGRYFLIDDNIKKKAKNQYNFQAVFNSTAGKVNESEADQNIDDNGETNDLGMVIADELLSQNRTSIGSLFFNLPTVEEAINDLKKKD